MTNRRRAKDSEHAVDTFTLKTYGHRTFAELVDDDKQTAIYDLICDLGHLARREGLVSSIEDYEALLDSALRHYTEEHDLGWDEEAA